MRTMTNILRVKDLSYNKLSNEKEQIWYQNLLEKSMHSNNVNKQDLESLCMYGIDAEEYNIIRDAEVYKQNHDTMDNLVMHSHMREIRRHKLDNCFSFLYTGIPSLSSLCHRDSEKTGSGKIGKYWGKKLIRAQQNAKFRWIRLRRNKNKKDITVF